MSVIYLLLPCALLLGAGFLAGFLWVVSQGQYDELDTPAHRMLLDDEIVSESLHYKVPRFSTIKKTRQVL